MVCYMRLSVSRCVFSVAVFLFGFVSLLPTQASAVQRSKAQANKPQAVAVSKAKPAVQTIAARAGTKSHSNAHSNARSRPAVRANARHKSLAGHAKGAFRAAALAPAPARLSYGQMAGLHDSLDPLDLKSSVALVIDQDTREVLFSKNEKAILPIASLTKLMTGLLVSEARLPMDELITISQEDVDTEKGSRSRLTVGTALSRGELLHLALMSSENRAAHALGRTYPGGLQSFVQRMNLKAQILGMHDTRYDEPTGLSSRNQSSAQDLATLVRAAYTDPVLRELSTSPGYQVEVGNRTLQYNNTNRLVKNPTWDIGLQKTGYISEAGQCLVMQAKIAGRKLIMVFLDSAGKLSRLGDAERVKTWLEGGHALASGLAPVSRRLGGE
jgi:serine-type D-Ala-D-Ala endopeptidase (penicillin-binding protein 7)